MVLTHIWIPTHNRTLLSYILHIKMVKLIDRGNKLFSDMLVPAIFGGVYNVHYVECTTFYQHTYPEALFNIIFFVMYISLLAIQLIKIALTSLKVHILSFYKN